MSNPQFKFTGQIVSAEGPDVRGLFVVKIDGRLKQYVQGVQQDIIAQLRIAAPRQAVGHYALGDDFEIILNKAAPSK